MGNDAVALFRVAVARLSSLCLLLFRTLFSNPDQKLKGADEKFNLIMI